MKKKCCWMTKNESDETGPYFLVFSLNTGKYEPEKTPYLDSFQAMGPFLFFTIFSVSSDITFMLNWFKEGFMQHCITFDIRRIFPHIFKQTERIRKKDTHYLFLRGNHIISRGLKMGSRRVFII